MHVYFCARIVDNLPLVFSSLLRVNSFLSSFTSIEQTDKFAKMANPQDTYRCEKLRARLVNSLKGLCAHICRLLGGWCEITSRQNEVPISKLRTMSDKAFFYFLVCLCAFKMADVERAIATSKSSVLAVACNIDWCGWNRLRVFDGKRKSFVVSMFFICSFVLTECLDSSLYSNEPITLLVNDTQFS